MTESDRKKLITANINCLLMQVSSCSCVIKTPNADYHYKDCKYRLAQETSALICAVLKNTENKNVD